MHILLVEDDPMLGKALKEALIQDTHVVDHAFDYESAETALLTGKFDIIILDVNLPDKSGLELLKILRQKNNNIPVLILTARSATYQKVEGLDLGADDYLIKPFDLDELSARINALYRRSKNLASPLITHKDLTLNSNTHKLCKGAKEVTLSPKEFAILRMLLENLNKVIAKSSLEEMLYSWDNFIESNTVEVHIHHLRGKLGKDIIKTIRGIGYIIEQDTKA